MHQNQVENQSN